MTKRRTDQEWKTQFERYESSHFYQLGKLGPEVF